tara:strand:- start:207 stop:1415 length:1209 start_codon:yes stop_codon:yes gene_type:complete
MSDQQVLNITTTHTHGLMNVKPEKGKYAVSGILWAEGTWRDAAGRVLRHSRDVVERAVDKFRDALIDIEHNNKSDGKISDVRLIRDTIYKIQGIGTMNSNPGLGKGFSPEFEVDAIYDVATNIYHVIRIKSVKFVSVVETPACKACPVQTVSRMSAQEKPSCAITCSNGSNEKMEKKLTDEEIAILQKKVKDSETLVAKLETDNKTLVTEKTTLETTKVDLEKERETLTADKETAITAGKDAVAKLETIKSQFTEKSDKPADNDSGHVCEATSQIKDLTAQFNEFKENTSKKLQVELESSLNSKFVAIKELNADVSTDHISELDVPLEVKLKMAEALHGETVKFSEMKKSVEEKSAGKVKGPAIISKHSTGEDVTSAAKEYIKTLGYDPEKMDLKLNPEVTV